MSSQRPATREERTITAADDRPSAATHTQRSQKDVHSFQKVSEIATAAVTSKIVTDTRHALPLHPFQIFLSLSGLFLLMWQMSPLLKRITLSKQPTDPRGDPGPPGQGNRESRAFRS